MILEPDDDHPVASHGPEQGLQGSHGEVSGSSAAQGSYKPSLKDSGKGSRRDSGHQGRHQTSKPVVCAAAAADDDVEAALRSLSLQEQRQIREVMRKDTVLRLYTELKVR